MIINSYNNLYIGVTDNPERRLSEHNSKRGSEFTKIRNKFEIVFLEKYDTLSDARKREIQIKKWSRKKKEFLIDKYHKGLSTKKYEGRNKSKFNKQNNSAR
ncbi:MAG: Endo/excinuclease amino domain protein [Candidatus Nomurabacteria bacterium GW2011_GWB1_37_5]|uniref:Endo/excinuclease amino domain protein n=1 Tax=Candidatus Nomurabacteria bacterium GW2011_GWB1_37_5 TaxID=1618742 RepID=A0A0G0H7H9_9BACT|nr:MAG: Endo/excinuclease amino domain protein [Candidatus Nomurabacteria bacterium GW2011_GWB1_37_5]